MKNYSEFKRGQENPADMQKALDDLNRILGKDKTAKQKPGNGSTGLKDQQVDWNKIDQLEHNREADGKPRQPVKKEVDWKTINALPHNKFADTIMKK